ncbi:MAG TPA: DUF4870 domain-containing protein [Terrimicrobiaceae bacterium]|nr:DUF4870 domain-containing protein [Terrimicrobiaceae bacterium]
MDTPPPIDAPLATPPPPPEPADPVLRQWTVILHLSALAGLLVPFGNILAPLIIWLVKKPEIPALQPAGKAVLNFQVSYSLYFVGSFIAAVILSCLVVPIVLPFIVFIAWLVLTILGAVKASNGESYQFPLVMKLID